MPPISVYRIGGLHFVRDGHHRVSVARALGRTAIDGHVTEVLTRLPPSAAMTVGDIPLKSRARGPRPRPAAADPQLERGGARPPARGGR